MTWPKVYPMEIRQAEERYRHSSSGKYYALPLPSSVEEIGFTEGDSVYLTLEKGETALGESLRYIRGAKKADSRHELTIRCRDDRYPPLFVRLPVEYTEHNENSPFHGIEAGDEANLEISTDTGEFLVFQPDDYRFRIQHLSSKGLDFLPTQRAPAIIPFIDLHTGGVDLAADTAFSGQRFEIIPFDATGPDIAEKAREIAPEVDAIRRRNKDSGMSFWYAGQPEEDVTIRYTGELLYELSKKVDIEEIINSKISKRITIVWNPDIIKYPRDITYPIYSTTYADRISVVLPSKSFFSVQLYGSALPACRIYYVDDWVKNYLKYDHVEEDIDEETSYGSIEEVDKSEYSRFFEEYFGYPTIDEKWASEYGIKLKSSDKIQIFAPCPPEIPYSPSSLHRFGKKFKQVLRRIEHLSESRKTSIYDDIS